MPGRRAAAVAAAVLAAAVVVPSVAGCGENDEPVPAQPTAPAGKLTRAERDLVLESERAIGTYCRKRARALADLSKRPTVEQQARALEAIDALVGLAGQKPAARLRRGVDVRLFLGDLAENLEGSNCDPAIVARLDQGLAELAQGG